MGSSTVLENNAPANRAKTDTRFKKGQSGNPAGRPKQTPAQKDALTAIKDLAPDAAAVLRELIHSRKAPAAVRLKAAEIVLNRVYGKAETPITVNALNAVEQYEVEEKLQRQWLDEMTDAEFELYEKLCARFYEMKEQSKSQV